MSSAKRGSGDRTIPPSGQQAVKARNAIATKKPPPAKKEAKKKPPKVLVDPSIPPDGYRPPSGETPAADIGLPSLHRELVAPFVAVGSRRFEELCRSLLRIAYPQLARASLKRTSGVEQYGVDVEGFDDDAYPTVVLSAKCYNKIRAWDFRPWIDDFLRHLDTHWKDKKVGVFILAVTCEFNDDDMNDAARILIGELKARHIAFVPWDTVRMTEFLREDSGLVKQFFNEAWVEALVVRRPVEQLVIGRHMPADPRNAGKLLLIEQLTRLETDPIWQQLGQAQTASLEDALKQLRRGSSNELESWLSEAKKDAVSWEHLDVKTRSKALRAAAMLRAQDEHLPEAAELLDQADALSDPPDATARAFLLRMQGDAGGALGMLRNRSTQHEREFAAALLIEASRAAEALRELRPLAGPQVTPEVLRLRAIALFLQGDRERALQDAASASERAPREIAPLLSLASIRFFSALANGVRPQFGGMPQPLAPGLLKGTAKALALLAQAIDDFDELRRTVEGTLRDECEMWHFASLLLHPDRRDDAARRARALLSRDDVEPIAVGWALTFGLVRRPGRIKKMLGDAVREGRGTPSHLIAFALMNAASNQLGQAAAVIRKHAHRFPQAKELLDVWRLQLGDPSAEATTTFASALRDYLAYRDSTNLQAHLEAPSTPVEELLSAAECLAAHSDWQKLAELQPRLVSIGTRRTITLACLSAINSNDPESCLSILCDPAVAVPGAPLVRSLIYLRIKANEALGRHKPVIADLEAIREEGGDAYIDRRLLDAYARIGALQDFERIATKVLDEGQLDPTQHLMIARFLRSAAPATARRALEAATKALPSSLVAPAISLAGELGASEIQSMLMRTLSGKAPETGVIAFSNIEELQTFLLERTREHQERFAEWLAGRVPAAMALHGNAKTFVRLYLSGPEQRRNDAGEAFPMLLRTGGTRPIRCSPGGDRPVLRLDLSGLLLAERLGIVSQVEAAFTIEVPPALPDALQELASAFHPMDAAFLDDLKRALDSNRSALRFDAPPPHVEAIESIDKRGSLDAGVVSALLAQAYADGHLDEAKLDKARRFLETAGPQTKCAAVIASPYALYRLTAAGIIQAVSRGTPLFVLPDDAVTCRSELQRWIHENELVGTLTALRAKTAERLIRGKWTTIGAHVLTGLDEKHGRAAPHVRCLMETVTAQAVRPVLFWIEDRFLSHASFEGALDVLDILAQLHDRGHITKDQEALLRHRLRIFGYGYMPIDCESISAEIAAAHIDGLSLIETEELAAIRRWLAVETKSLAHVDPHPRYDEQGNVVSEARRLIDIGGLARRLLVEVWGSASVTPTKRARSNWIWTFLRVGPAARGPIVETSALLEVTAAVAAHTLDIPLLSDFSNADKTPIEVDREFIEWFAAVEIEPLAQGNPSAESVVADHLAAIVDRLLENSPDMGPEESTWLRRYFAARANRFIEALPSAWGDRVLERRRLGEKLGVHKVVTFSFGEGAFTAIALHDAYIHALTSKRPDGCENDIKVPLTLVGGGRALLRLALSDPNPDIPFIVVGEKEGRIDAAQAALLLPDARQRGAALSRVEGLVTKPGCISSADLEAVAVIEDVESRFTAFSNILDADITRSLGKLSDILCKNRLSLSDLDVPSVASLQAYLRCAGANGSLTWQAIAESRLLVDLDVPSVACRLAGLPTDPTDTLLRSLDSWLRTAGPDALDTKSPLLALLRLRALITGNKDDPSLLILGVNALISSYRDRGRLFCAMVRHLTIGALDRSDWRELDLETFVTMIWIYADSFIQVIPIGAENLDGFAEALQARAGYGGIKVEIVETYPDWWRWSTVDLRSERLEGVIVGVVLHDGLASQISDEAIEPLRAMVAFPWPENMHPRIPVIPIPPMAPSHFWCTRDVVAETVAVGWVESGLWCASRDDAVMAARLMDLDWHQDGRPMLPVFLSMVNFRSITLGDVRKIYEAVDEINAEVAFEPASGAVQKILGMRAAALGRLDDLDGMQAVLKAQAARCAGRWQGSPLREMPIGDAATTAFQLLSDSAYAHAASLPRTSSERLSAFASSLRIIAEYWPHSTRLATETLDAVIRKIAVKDSVNLWAVLLDLRERL